MKGLFYRSLSCWRRREVKELGPARCSSRAICVTCWLQFIPPSGRSWQKHVQGSSVPHHWMHHAAQPAWTRRASDASFPFRDDSFDKAIDAGSSLVTYCRGPPLRALCTHTHCTESRLGAVHTPSPFALPPSAPVSSSPRESRRRCPSRRVKRARGRRAAPAPCDSNSNAAVIPRRAPPPRLRVPAFLRSKVLAPKPSSLPLMSSATSPTRTWSTPPPPAPRSPIPKASMASSAACRSWPPW